jgi:hypothetical protein
MSMLINESSLKEQIIADREARGIDQHDEVWEGVYVVSPLANNEHQDLVAGFIGVFFITIKAPGLGSVYPGINVSDRDEDWISNYRVPDVGVALNDCHGVNRVTHWVGALSFLVEVSSDGDQCHEKLPFYELIGVEEVLIVNRDPWSLELYRLKSGTLVLVGTSDLANPAILESAQLPLTFQLQPGLHRPVIRIVTKDGKQAWQL